MFATVRKWVEEQPDARNLNHILSSASVKAGKNHSGGTTGTKGGHDHGALGGHGKTSGSLWSEIKTRDMTSLSGGDFNPNDPSFNASGGRPISPAYTPQQGGNYGYNNNNFENNRPTSSGGYQGQAQNSYYQSQPSPSYPPNNYGGGPPPNQYGGPPPGNYGPPPGQYGQAPPYPTEQTYGGYNQYQQGPPQPPYGQPYQNPPYPPQNQYDNQPPYGGGNSGGFPGGGYYGGR